MCVHLTGKPQISNFYCFVRRPIHHSVSTVLFPNLIVVLFVRPCLENLAFLFLDFPQCCYDFLGVGQPELHAAFQAAPRGMSGIKSSGL